MMQHLSFFESVNDLFRHWSLCYCFLGSMCVQLLDDLGAWLMVCLTVAGSSGRGGGSWADGLETPIIIPKGVVPNQTQSTSINLIQKKIVLIGFIDELMFIF